MGSGFLAISKRDFSVMAMLGVMLIVYQFFYLAAINRIGISAATLISLCGAPVLVVIASALFLDDRLTGTRTLALAGALVGTAMIVGWRHGGTGETRDSVIGVALSLGSATGIATHVFVSRLIAGRHHSSRPLAIGFPAGALVFMPFALGRGMNLDLNFPAWTLLIYLAVGPSVIAYWLYQRGLQEVSATDASIVTLLEPLIAAILAAFLFDERLGLLGWAGALLLIGSITLLTLTAPSRTAAPSLALEPVGEGLT
jgi:DME family drug/metabolite transporter